MKNRKIMKLSRPVFLVLFTSLLSLILTGCGSSIESNTDDLLEEMDDLLAELKGIDDSDSAADGIDKIKAITENIKELRQEREDLVDAMSSKEKREFQELFEDEYQDKFKDTLQKITEEKQRMASHSWYAEVSEVLHDLDFALGKALVLHVLP